MQWHLPSSQLELADKEVHLWRVSLQVSEEVLEELYTILSLEEQERAARFKFPEHRRRSIVARATLRHILSYYLDIAPAAIQFEYGEYGKPFIQAGQNKLALQFNMSDANEIALYGIRLQQEIGIDIEYIQRKIDYEQLAQRFFAPAEYQALLAVPAAKRLLAFFYGWTRKEAFIKALGAGLAYGLAEFEVALVPDQPAKLLTIKNSSEAAQAWTLNNIEIDAEYMAALATYGVVAQMKQFVWSPEVKLELSR